MKFSENWLREWVDPALDAGELAHQLTMAGLEVDSLERDGEGLDGVVVAEVLSVEKHPDADRLTVCEVSSSEGEAVGVVCGAPNVYAGMKSPLAVPGTQLPNGMKLTRSKIRGVESNGMLCSAIEIGLGDEADGIVELPKDAPTGQALADYLGLPDNIFDFDLTPNRGDCFSVLGIARDAAAITATPLNGPDLPAIKAAIKDEYPVELVLPEGCPRFAGRVVKGIDSAANSPLWMTERLRRSGLRAIHPVVDVTNYVMLELGQPLHAYDLALLQGPIQPRLARSGEKVTLLDEREVELNPDTLIITDDSGPIGMAGIMGGLSTAVSERTEDVFFEAAFWPQAFMAGRARSYGMHTDASLRFERGVDPTGQARAVERATELLIGIAGGRAGPLVDEVNPEHLPKSRRIEFRRSRLGQVLGTDIDAERVGEILENLHLDVDANDVGWTVKPPGFRFDLEIEDDLVEEVARIYGYDQIPETTAIGETPLGHDTETRIDIELIADTLVAREYQEVITYSFVAQDMNEKISGERSELILSNPISAEMSVMRSSVWPGLLDAAAVNVSRQQDRVRVFEIGKTFHGTLKEPREVVRVAGLALGNKLQEQWGSPSQPVDFFDIKSDVSALLKMVGERSRFDYVAVSHPALQPGQAANIVRENEAVGVIGKLHPTIASSLELKNDVFVFELDAEKTFAADVPSVQKVSRFPAIRRDIAVVVNDEISAADIVRVAESAAPELIQNVRIFDVYKGPGIEAGRKSVALGLILQETSRTLTDADADAAMAAAVRDLQQEFAAILRE